MNNVLPVSVVTVKLKDRKCQDGHCLDFKLSIIGRPAFNLLSVVPLSISSLSLNEIACQGFQAFVTSNSYKQTNPDLFAQKHVRTLSCLPPFTFAP